MSPEVTVEGRQLSLSNLDKVMYPETGTAKADVIDYYARVAPAMLPHLKGRPITLVRFPDGVGGNHFFEKNCPSHRPPWIKTLRMGISNRRGTQVDFCLLDEAASLVWTANLAALELHPGLAVEPDLDRPTVMVFDLDPGPPAGVIECARVAMLLREAFERLSLESFPKTSGSKGLQLYVPLNTAVNYQRTRDVSLAIAQVLEKQHPDLITTTMAKDVRPNKVFIDWSQNARHKTTVGVYSLRARARPTVSTPVSWDEVSDALESNDAEALRFEFDETLRRVDERGDLFAPVLELEQELPA